MYDDGTTTIANADAIMLLFMYNIAFVVGALKAYHDAWVCKDTMNSTTRQFVSTQRKRYLAIFVGQLIMALMAYALLRLGLSNVWKVAKILTHDWSANPMTFLFGWSTIVVQLLVLLSPVITIVTFLRVYSQPTWLAKYTGEGDAFYTTKGQRDGTGTMVTLT